MSLHVLRAINAYCQRTGEAPSTVGRNAINDPRLTIDLRQGRELRRKTERAVMSYIEGRRTAQ